LEAEMTPIKSLVKTREACKELIDRLHEAGAKQPGLLYAYAVGSLVFDAEGELLNEQEIVEALQNNFPEQFKTEAA
jgi:hypothetical protein